MAADAARLVHGVLSDGALARVLQRAAAVDVIAAGKAAAPMLGAFLGGAPPSLRRVVGIGTESDSTWPSIVRWHTTPHPVPDDRSVSAARDALETARASRTDDLLVVLLSGGASSMMAIPAEGLTLSDKQATATRMLSLGAEVHDLNVVRKHLSAIKGGRLAAAYAGATVTYALSDVVGDDLSSIGSGPTVPDPSTYFDALEILGAYGGHSAYPQAVIDHLTRGVRGAIPETPKPGDARLARATSSVIGSIRTAMAGARAAAESMGYVVHVVDRSVTGEARDAALALLDDAKRFVRSAAGASTQPSAGDCIISGGETTVRTTGSGKGGRNQEFALALAPALIKLGSLVVAASVGTDGIDGPTDAAGAIVDSTTIPRALAAGIGGVDRYLLRHDSYIFFDQLGDLIRTGPTGTNVGDVQVILVGGVQ